MTSKEKTLNRLEYQGRINIEEMQKNGRISLINKLETEYLKEVLKDLEILEVLKNHLEIYNTDFVNEDGDDVFAIRLKEMNANKLKVIEEWLENGNTI